MHLLILTIILMILLLLLLLLLHDAVLIYRKLCVAAVCGHSIMILLLVQLVLHMCD